MREIERYIGYALALSLVVIGCMAFAEHQEAQAKEQQEKEQQARAEQVESVKLAIADAESEEMEREATQARINEEKRVKQEQEEQARREEEERAAYEAWLATQYSYTPATTYDTTTINSGTLTKSGGVNYYNGRCETWYSSNQLYHKDTKQWTAGSDGVYRDSEGYVVIASSDHNKGSVVDTSLGKGKVYDAGCAKGTTDIYTKW